MSEGMQTMNSNVLSYEYEVLVSFLWGRFLLSIKSFNSATKKERLCKKERERDRKKEMNEGGNGGENQGAVNDQRRRMRSSSFANLPPPRGKVCEKIVEEVYLLLSSSFFSLSLFICPSPLSLLLFVFFFYLCFQSPFTWLHWKGKLLLFVFFFYLCSQNPSTWLEHPNRCFFSTFSHQKTYCSHSESRSIHKTFPNFCWSYYNSSLNFFIWYRCSSNNFFYLNNSIKWALPLWPTWFCCFK